MLEMIRDCGRPGGLPLLLAGAATVIGFSRRRLAERPSMQ
jgi:hypothetical protein